MLQLPHKARNVTYNKMDNFVDYICHVAMQPNVVFNPVLHIRKPGVEWINYHTVPSPQVIGGVSSTLNTIGYETWESYAIKDHKRLRIIKLGAGAFGYCYLVEDLSGKFRGAKVVFKVAYDKESSKLDDIDTREIKIGKQMSMMCLGPVRRKTPLASPYMIRVYGSVQTQFVTQSYWYSILEKKEYGGQKITKNTCMILEHVSKFTFKVPKEIITYNKYKDWKVDGAFAISSPRSGGEFFRMMDGNPSLCSNGWVQYVLFQALITIAVFGRRFRHNDISTSNVMITPYEGPQWAFEFKVSKSRALYFRIPIAFNFQIKIHDFGYTVDLNHGEELDREMLKSAYKCGDKASCDKQRIKITKWREQIGLEAIHSQYYDPYLFLYWANAGLSHNQTFPGDCAPFHDFMDRLGMKKFPGKEGRLSSEMQKEADQTGAYKGFRMYTAIEMLQDSYFKPYHISKSEFERLPKSQRITIPFHYDENVPTVDVSACRSFMAPIIKNSHCGKTLLETEIRTDLSVPFTTAYVPHS